MIEDLEIKNQLRQWIAKKHQGLDPNSIAEDTPLIEQRLLTSIQVLDLIMFLEHLRGKPVDVTRLEPGSFRSIGTIYSHFFAQE